MGDLSPGRLLPSAIGGSQVVKRREEKRMHGGGGGGESQQKHGGRHVVIDFIAGSLGATTSVYVGQPLDTLKVKMQTFPEMYPNLGTCVR